MKNIVVQISVIATLTLNEMKRKGKQSYRQKIASSCFAALAVLAMTVVAFLLTGFITVNAQEEYIQAPAAIQISSIVSDGKLSLSEIIEDCRKNNIKIIMLTDRDLMNWEYGLWPLARIIKKTEESNSVFKYGIKKYFQEVEALQNKNKDLVLIPGIEAAPFYYWQGSPLSGKFKILDWHKHVLVFGLEKISDYNNLPSVSNRLALTRPYSYKDIYLFWPVLVFILGVLFFNKRQISYQDAHGREWGRYSKKWGILGVCLMFIGVIFSLNNFPFRGFKYDQYHGDQGVMPYQDLINYVNRKSGLTFWAHPEAKNIEKIGMVGVETREHTEDLLKSFDYTGFAVLYEGYQKIGLPGGIWDELLKQYCFGQRKSPVFAIAGLSFDQAGDLDEALKDLRTVLLLPRLGRDEALAALKQGKMYVLRGKNSSQFILDAFTARGISGGIKKTMGDEIKTSQGTQLEIKGGFWDGQSKPFKIKLIRNGDIIKVFEVNSPFDLAYYDADAGGNRKIYYRIEAEANGLHLITNPIFVSAL